MRNLAGHKVLRVVDANFNRAKEGLRVCEDVVRFVLDQKEYTQRYKKIRHQLSDICSLTFKGSLMDARAIEGDVGKKTSVTELKRKNIKDIFYANSQRVKESVRVLEEFLKLVSPQKALACKRMRYKIYALERKVFEKMG
ncbi:MAG: thiamine-phosphate pyrophosphorylase [Candidatus Omnitrophota bacterium]|jgi:thiamine-phosphate pyrophosphorylase